MCWFASNANACTSTSVIPPHLYQTTRVSLTKGGLYLRHTPADFIFLANRNSDISRASPHRFQGPHCAAASFLETTCQVVLVYFFANVWTPILNLYPETAKHPGAFTVDAAVVPAEEGISKRKSKMRCMEGRNMPATSTSAHARAAVA